MIPRTLYANEIECRVGHNTEKGASLLLYKDARVDMRILDETFTPMGWKRSHQLINNNLFCTIEVWDQTRQIWVAKQDVGTESNTEKEKGEASDSFKRAGFNWGIGRELYTAPFIWVTITAEDLDTKGRIKTKFYCREIDYNDKREISHLVIVDGNGKERFNLSAKTKEDDILSVAIAELEAAPDRKTLNQLWNKYNELQSNKTFSNTCMQMCAKYPKS